MSKSENPTHTIYFARHGESTANLTHITTPPDEDVLTEKGKRQAEVMGKYLKDKNVHFTVAYSSSLPRAADSARIILKANRDEGKSEVELKEDPRIREKDFGDFMGKHAMDAYKALENAYRQGTPVLKFEMPGAEPAAEFESRLDSFLDDLFRYLRTSQTPETVLIVAHGICMFRLLGKLRSRTTLPIESSEFTQACKRPMPNTGYHLLTIKFSGSDGNDPRKIPLEFQAYHQKSHLESLEKENPSTRSDMNESAKSYNMDLDMISQCALQ